jgi:hypothetical protein
MTNYRVGFPSVARICAHVKQVCYAVGGRIRLYGEEFKVVPDPMSSIQWDCSGNDEETHAFAGHEFP